MAIADNMLSVAVEYHQEMTMFADFYKDEQE